MKPQCKISYECPHCKETIVRETHNYHKVIHGKYFKKDEVVPFETIKEKVESGEWSFGILHDAFAWSRYFTCDHCSSHVSVVMGEGSFNGDRYKETWRFKVQKAGNRLDGDKVKRLFEKIGKFSRNVPDDYKETGNHHCEKEIFMQRVWKLISKDIAKKPWVIKTDKYKGIMYVARIDYALGHYEDIKITGFDISGQMVDLTLNEGDLARLEWLPFEDEIAKQVYMAIFSM
jgi:hypothetical protein